MGKPFATRADLSTMGLVLSGSPTTHLTSKEIAVQSVKIMRRWPTKSHIWIRAFEAMNRTESKRCQKGSQNVELGYTCLAGYKDAVSHLTVR